jgi:hypothetical protein
MFYLRHREEAIAIIAFGLILLAGVELVKQVIYLTFI